MRDIDSLHIYVIMRFESEGGASDKHPHIKRQSGKLLPSIVSLFWDANHASRIWKTQHDYLCISGGIVEYTSRDICRRCLESLVNI